MREDHDAMIRERDSWVSLAFAATVIAGHSDDVFRKRILERALEKFRGVPDQQPAPDDSAISRLRGQDAARRTDRSARRAGGWRGDAEPFRAQPCHDGETEARSPRGGGSMRAVSALSRISSERRQRRSLLDVTSSALNDFLELLPTA
jgi:hypothetical protein